jgi:hypothetical protein
VVNETPLSLTGMIRMATPKTTGDDSLRTDAATERRRLAALIRAYRDGWITNEESDDQVTEGEWQDNTVQEIAAAQWATYDDTATYRLLRSRRPAADLRDFYTRCLLFLHSDLELEEAELEGLPPGPLPTGCRLALLVPLLVTGLIAVATGFAWLAAFLIVPLAGGVFLWTRAHRREAPVRERRAALLAVWPFASPEAWEIARRRFPELEESMSEEEYRALAERPE